jgi:hypothetical protein
MLQFGRFRTLLSGDNMKIRLVEIAVWICIAVMACALIANAPYKTKFVIAGIGAAITLVYASSIRRLR